MARQWPHAIWTPGWTWSALALTAEARFTEMMRYAGRLEGELPDAHARISTPP
jgi:hypothetical protein